MSLSRQCIRDAFSYFPLIDTPGRGGFPRSAACEGFGPCMYIQRIDLVDPTAWVLAGSASPPRRLLMDKAAEWVLRESVLVKHSRSQYDLFSVHMYVHNVHYVPS